LIRKLLLLLLLFLHIPEERLLLIKLRFFREKVVEGNNKVVTLTSGGDFTYTATIPYKDAMKVSELMLKITGCKR